MTHTSVPTHELSGDDGRTPSTAASPPLAERRPTGFPLHRAVVVHVTGGLDGVVRVATMLRGRRYRVRDLAVDLREGVVVSEVRATVLLTAPETGLLLERLRRLAVVISADSA